MEEGRWEWVGSARTYFVSRALFMLPDVISYIETLWPLFHAKAI